MKNEIPRHFVPRNDVNMIVFPKFQWAGMEICPHIDGWSARFQSRPDLHKDSTGKYGNLPSENS
jgi:hypothetical protein